MNANLSQQVALITGAARHIGRAIGDRYAANGATVIYTDVRFDPEDQPPHPRSGRRTVSMDVTDESQVASVIDGVVREHGRLDILVNNAGLICMDHRVTIDEFPSREWSRILDVDLTGVFLASRAAAKQMSAQGSGRIINIASVAGIVPVRLQSPYVAAKAGVVNLTKAMALELGPRGVLVNCIAPGSILTDGTRKLFYGDGDELSENARRLIAHIPLHRPGTSDDIAYAALFLAAPESAYVNGHCLTVDGGWTAGYSRDF